jgi:hypothetical protein
VGSPAVCESITLMRRAREFMSYQAIIIALKRVSLSVLFGRIEQG